MFSGWHEIDSIYERRGKYDVKFTNTNNAVNGDWPVCDKVNINCDEKILFYSSVIRCIKNSGDSYFNISDPVPVEVSVRYYCGNEEASRVVLNLD